MKKKIILKGPFLSRSGYGEQARFALRSLRTREELLDIYIINIRWGKTGWIWEDTEERRWIDENIKKTVLYIEEYKKHNMPPQFDLSLQITIPQEWEKMAPINIGYTAGTESTKISPQWIEKCKLVDKILVTSNHAKYAFDTTKYKAQNPQTGEVIDFENDTKIEIVSYPVRQHEPCKDFKLDLKHDFNFLCNAQWSPRKNIENTIRWWLEEFWDQEVGLVVKGNTASNSYMDRGLTEHRLEKLLKEFEDRKCSVYLLHGDLSESELSALYQHRKIKAFINLAHGEGFGLPVFEAAYYGLPVIAPDWGGVVDFLYAPKKDKKGKEKKKHHFTKVDYELKPIQKDAVWEPILIKDSMWAFPKQGSYKMGLRKIYKNYDVVKKEAKKLQKWILEEFNNEKRLNDFFEKCCLDHVEDYTKPCDYIFVNDFFREQGLGGAEMSLGAIIDSCKDEYVKLNSTQITKAVVDYHRDKTWIFGNIAQMDEEMIRYVMESDVEYHFIEFDYKLCEYRNPELYKFVEDEECDYSETDKGKLIRDFINKSKNTFFMSDEQMKIYQDSFGDIEGKKMKVLSSVFNEDFFKKIQILRKEAENIERKGWLVLGSRNWVKGSSESERWCKNNDLDHEVVMNVSHDDMLRKLSTAEGVCFKPSGLDTCPRFIIEAKLLGCKLEVNKNVQHKKEEWFDIDDVDKIISYLKSRPEYFWKHVR